ncbi:MAG TPA: single-stranded DNA-binding protein, partial [Firmicutes bacterium]|nr:single-stranded DNA-binding protein [Bacillota bacterium]
MNKAFIVGRLTKAPDHKTTPSGVSVATFTVAVTRRTNREETDFLNVVTWRGLADNCGKYLVKGQQVAVAGEIRTRTYEAKDGGKR